MSATQTLHPEDKVKAGKLGKKMMGAGLGLALAMIILSLILGNAEGDGWRRFFHAYLIGWTFATSIAIGALFFIIIHHLTRARWSTTTRRLAEIVTGAFPMLMVAGLGIIIPVAAGYDKLFFWSWHEVVDSQNPAHPLNHLHHHLHAKLGWLSPGFFALRFFIYMGLYIAVSRYFASKSRLQDETGDPKLSENMRVAAGPAVIVYGLVTVFFGFDFLMSTAPKWYSTIYSVNFWGGAMIGTYATLILLALGIQRAGLVKRTITTEHYHDLGKWLFAFTFFWAYTAFSQFMLIWYANMPEETVFYKYRMFNDWQWVSIGLGVLHWAFPFVFLLSRWTKRILPLLAAFAVWQLVFHWVDLYWNVMPHYDWTGGAHAAAGAAGDAAHHGAGSFLPGPLTGDPTKHHIGFSPVDVTMWLAMIGVLVAGIGSAFKGTIVPVKDPQLSNALAHENM